MNNNLSAEILELAKPALDALSGLDVDDRMTVINRLREAIHHLSPMASEPVDFVAWVKNDMVYANDYNPNSVAPPEMELLRVSISHDGYTQPIVSMADDDGRRQVIDGFHRHRVGKECADIQARVHGYLPVVQIRASQTSKNDRMASTIRHNRARGKHKVEAMSDIVIELKRRNWSDERISRELGMDADEVLRLCQITGLAEVFADGEFSQAWGIGYDNSPAGEILSDLPAVDYVPKDDGRVLHTFDKWECYRAGFYAERPPGKMTLEEAERAYTEFLADPERFRAALEVVTTQWPFSCEHYLTNDRMNRIAWLGQASVAQALGIPSGSRGGYHGLTDAQKEAADQLALEYLNRWLVAHGRPEVDMAGAGGRTEMELY